MQVFDTNCIPSQSRSTGGSSALSKNPQVNLIISTLRIFRRVVPQLFKPAIVHLTLHLVRSITSSEAGRRFTTMTAKTSLHGLALPGIRLGTEGRRYAAATA